jgi:transcriptional regulator with XRE-family HTH domain
MIIGERIKQIRALKKLSQADIERETGLLCCYISRVENGHTVPSVETLEKFAHALQVPMYQLFYDSEQPPEVPDLPKHDSAEEPLWGTSGPEARILAKFQRVFSRLEEDDLGLVFFMAQKMQRRKVPSK